MRYVREGQKSDAEGTEKNADDSLFYDRPFCYLCNKLKISTAKVNNNFKNNKKYVDLLQSGA